MAMFNCEMCGNRVGRFSFRKDCYVYEDGNVSHKFCSLNCLNEWRSANRSKSEFGGPIVSEDLEQVYYKKLGDYRNLLSAMACASSDADMKRIKGHLSKLKEEINALGNVLGKDMDDGEQA